MRAAEPTLVGQSARIAEEVRYLLAHDDRLTAEATWWQAASERPLLELVRRSFLTRQRLLRAADSDGSWRNALSYIGDKDPLDTVVCAYDYGRAEVTVPPDSPLAQPYPWAPCDGVEIDTWYASCGMASITSWLLAAGAIAAERGPHRLVTNRLYYETDVLFDIAGHGALQVRRHCDRDDLAAAVAGSELPGLVFLDSSQPGGGADAVAGIMAGADPERVACIAWDNTCVPAHDDPLPSGAGLTVPLVVLRSHVKLDQLGLELCLLGSTTLMAPVQAPDPWRKRLQRLTPDIMAATGAFAPPGSLRLLAALGLPSPDLAARANRCVRDANAIGGDVLMSELAPTGRFAVQQYEHGCFVNVHILDRPAAERLDRLEAEMTEVEQLAAQRAIPVWKSASFGFHYTAVSWYEANGHAVLRVCLGGHDHGVAAECAELIARYLIG